MKFNNFIEKSIDSKNRVKPKYVLTTHKPAVNSPAKNILVAFCFIFQ